MFLYRKTGVIFAGNACPHRAVGIGLGRGLCREMRRDQKRAEKEYGAEGQNRTADTSLFRAVLCQLSYLGTRYSREKTAALHAY